MSTPARSTIPLLLAAVLLCTATPAAAQSRPKIGLALGGGGARGWAHVGVLRELEAMNIPVDYIAGTSIGAVVGGLYASGLTLDEIEHELAAIDWNDALTDRTQYRDLSFRRKEDEHRYLTEFEAGLKAGRLRFPPGLRSGQKLRLLLQSYLIPVAGIEDFSKLPIPFKAVAADLETGEQVVLDRGNLPLAIRASASIPGIFSPVQIDGRALIDGGIANNVPVDVVRDMGADIVIAVDVGSPLLDREKIGSLFSVTGQTMTFLTRKNTMPQLAKAEIVIAPDAAKYGTLQFGAHRELIPTGREAARAHASELAPLSVDPELWTSLVRARPQSDWRRRTIDFISVEGSGRVDHRIIRNLLTTRAGQPLDAERLRHDIARIYGLDDFELVTFEIREVEQRVGLFINLKDKSWGPTYVRFSLSLSDDLRGASSFGVVGSVTRTRMNALGAEWRNELHAGGAHGFSSEFFQPLDFKGRLFVSPGASVIRTEASLYEGSRRVAVYDVDQVAGWLDVGVGLDHWGELRLGVMRTAVEAGVDAGELGLPSHEIEIAGYHGALTIMNIDRPVLPLHGNALMIEYVDAIENLGSDDEYKRLEGAAYQVITRGRASYLVGFSGGSSLGTEIPFYDEFQLGGLLNLGGFATGQLHGQSYALLRTGVYVSVMKLPSQIGEHVHAGLFLESGNAWPSDAKKSVDDLHTSATIGLAADTIVGPVIVGYGHADTGGDQFYVAIGKTF